MSEEQTQSVVTPEMVAEYVAHFNVNEDVAVGSLHMWEQGQGELAAALVNGNKVLYPVVEAYFKAKGQEVPETVKVPLVEVPEEKLPETEETKE